MGVLKCIVKSQYFLFIQLKNTFEVWTNICVLNIFNNDYFLIETNYYKT